MYARRVQRKKNVLSTSFRSEAQATDSTWSGCHAKRAATSKDGQNLPVRALSKRSSRTELAVCKRRFVKRKPRGFIPYTWLSSMNEIHVNGCQLQKYPVVNAHPIPRQVRPEAT
jgi:hypothetical protein